MTSTDLAPARLAGPRRALRKRARGELWPTLAAITLGVALLDGLGAFDNLVTVGPTKSAGAMSMLLLLTVLATPRSLIRAIKYPRPLLLLVTWMLLSYAWTGYRGGFVKQTWRDLITVAIVLVVGQLFPVDRFLRTVLNTGYVMIGMIFLTVVAMPSRAFDPSEGGLRGPFLQKGTMGSALILIVAVALCIDPRPRVRRGLTGVVVVLLLVGKTTTGLASILLVLGLYFVLIRYTTLRTTLGRAFGYLMTGALVLFAGMYYEASNVLVSLSGKNLTFSNRTAIWKGVVAAIGRRPINGYGWSVWRALWLQPAAGIIAAAGFAVAESHDAALELLLRLGVIGLVLYVALLIKSVRNGLRLAALGDSAGVFAVLLATIIVIWGFSEAFPVNGVWVGLMGVAALPRRTPGAHPDESDEHLPMHRHRLLAPKRGRRG